MIVYPSAQDRFASMFELCIVMMIVMMHHKHLINTSHAMSLLFIITRKSVPYYPSMFLLLLHGSTLHPNLYSTTTTPTCDPPQK